MIKVEKKCKLIVQYHELINNKTKNKISASSMIKNIIFSLYSKTLSHTEFEILHFNKRVFGFCAECMFIDHL